MDLRSWIADAMSPTVMVVASPAAEAAVADRNGLTIADVLRPSGFLRNLNGIPPLLFPPRQAPLHSLAHCSPEHRSQSVDASMYCILLAPLRRACCLQCL